VLLDVADMQVTKKKILELKNHPQKGYSANKIKGVIEIKFRRNKGDSDNQFLKKIKSDYDKLKEIKKMINVGNENKDTFYNLIVLDKNKIWKINYIIFQMKLMLNINLPINIIKTPNKPFQLTLDSPSYGFQISK
jgi:hypothetical protein